MGNLLKYTWLTASVPTHHWSEWLPEIFGTRDIVEKQASWMSYVLIIHDRPEGSQAALVKQRREKRASKIVQVVTMGDNVPTGAFSVDPQIMHLRVRAKRTARRELRSFVNFLQLPWKDKEYSRWKKYRTKRNNIGHLRCRNFKEHISWTRQHRPNLIICFSTRHWTPHWLA